MSGFLRVCKRHWLLLLLVALILLGLSQLLAAATPAAGEPPLAPAAAGSAAPPFSEFQPMLERPLFSSTRHPSALSDEPVDNLDAQQLREAWRLSGIALERGRQLALFSERQGTRRLLLEVGMVLADDWRLEQIGNDHAVLSNGSNEVDMPLREPMAAPEVPSAPETAPPAGSPAPAPAVKTSAPSDTPAKQG